MSPTLGSLARLVTSLARGPLELALIGAMGISSCRTDLLGPVTARETATPVTPSAQPLPGEGDERPLPPRVPEMTSVHAFFVRDSLHVRVQLGTSTMLRPYEPERAGGWAVQVLVDADLTNGGYWLGYDYVVRGSEWTRDAGTFVTRRITLEPGSPGGWGPQSGVARFRQRPRHIEVAIPLAAIGGRRGEMALAIETYATVDCPPCPTGISHEWEQLVFHSVGDPLTALEAPARGRAVLIERVRVRPTIDADPSLAR